MIKDQTVLSSRKAIGHHAELIAAEYLTNAGLKFIEKNFYSHFGEIDLIFLDKNSIVFVEVKYRKNTSTMSAVESIHPRKCAHILKTAQSYMQRLKKYDNYDYRIDVITLSGSLARPHIDWLTNAIEY